MALNKWTSGDVITEREANNHGIRKGTESEISGISSNDSELGDHFYNSTTGFPQIQTSASSDKRGNLTCAPIVADETEMSVSGSTVTEIKSFSFFKHINGLNANQLVIIAEIKSNSNGTTANLRVRLNDNTSDNLLLNTSSSTYTIKNGTIDISNLSYGKQKVTLYLDSTGTATQKLIEVYAI